MLKRNALRRYLMALLYADNVPQDAECGVGPLWTNCNGERLLPMDHETRQIFEDAEKSYQLNPNDAAVIFYFQTVNYKVTASKIDGADFVLIIDLVVNAAGAEKRQDMLDTIEERLWYRLYSYATFIDATTDETLTSFMRWLSTGGMTISTTDDSNFSGRYTIRTIRMTVSTSECLERLDCGDVPLCFIWDDIPDFGNGC